MKKSQLRNIIRETIAKSFFTKELTEEKKGWGCWTYCWNYCKGMIGMQLPCITGCLARCHRKGVGNMPGQLPNKK